MNPTHCPNDGTPLLGALEDSRIGRTLAGRFTLLARLGAGSMGAVYRARQLPVGREVAIKILRSDRTVDDAAKARFLREARTNSLLTSPHTVTVFDFGQSEEGELYLAMELLEGESLGQRLEREKRLSPHAAVDVARQALRSLAEAHAKGIVHRDLKPDNIFFAQVMHGDEPEELVKVLDFGIAKMLGEGMSALNAVETQAGTVFGTPRYMSPEQAQAKPLDGRSDLYALGVILYHMLSGRPPFTDDDAVVVMARHIKTQPVPIRDAAPEADIPIELANLVMRAIEKDPDKRPATADAMSHELSAALEATRAGTSGVRASVMESTSSSIRVTRPSLRAPITRLVPAVRPAWLFGAAAAVLILAAGVAGLALRRNAHQDGFSSEPVGAKLPAPTAAAGDTKAPASANTPDTTIPVVDVNALPITGTAAVQGAPPVPNGRTPAPAPPRGRTAPPVAPKPVASAKRPGKAPVSQNQPAAAPAPAPANSASGRYGIFD